MSSIEAQRWQRLSHHLDRVLELPEDEWAGYVAALQRDDPITATELDRVLRARQDGRFAGFLGRGAPSPLSEPARTPLIGRRIGPYVIDAEIGRGGMGGVWRAKRTDGRFEGCVAIKLLHLSWLGQVGEQRFLLEGRLLARLDHPNIARLLDAGVLEDGQPYLVLEYLEGKPIDAYCDSAALDTEARIRLFLEVTAAVAQAHRHLIVHRDLKPSNVLVTTEGTVKLLDFGIAKLVDASPESAPTRTLLPGLTPRYAAPEQLLGNSITTATDVHALGIMLYELLVGRHPFVGKPATAATDAELMHATLSTTPPRASIAATAQAGRRRTLGDLDNILAKALEKNPAERYDSVGAFADDLRRFLAHEPVHARSFTVSYRAARFIRRYRGGVASALLIAAALIGTSVFAVTQMLEARSQRDHAVAEAQRSQAESDLTEFVIGDSLSRIPGDLVRRRLDRAREFIAQRYAGSPVLAAWLLVDVSGRYIDIGEDRAAAAVIRDVEAINNRVHDPTITAQFACDHADDLVLAANLAGAQASLTTGLESLRRVNDPPPSTVASCADSAGLLGEAQGDYGQAVVREKESQRMLVEAGMYGASRYTSTTNNLGRALNLAGDYGGGWVVMRDVLALMRKVGRSDTSAYWAMMHNACRALVGGGQPLRAMKLLDEAVTSARRGDSAFQPPFFVAACRASAGVLAGEPAADAALMTATQTAGAAGYLASSSFYPAMTVAAALDRDDLAAADSRWAPLAAGEDRALAAGNRSAESVRLLLVHARLDLAHGRNEAALHRLDLADSLIAARRQPINPDSYDLEVLRAQAAMQSGDYAAAAGHATSAVALARAAAVDESSSAWLGEALLARARAEKALGQADPAVADARQALGHLAANLLPTHPLVSEARGLQ
ncbi:MAG TPA: serine/threonine-protein kinase [Steroidobacteraceae bacterium]|jgi:serine/threonine-protein kinase|nr:serine/threonine-protein kinase [Steroidobacteraceae bacterium]